MKLPPRYGNISKLSGNRRRPYRVRVFAGYDVHMKPKYETLGYTATRAEALEMLADYHVNPVDVSQRKVTFKEIYDRWIKTRSGTISADSIKAYDSAVKHFFPLFDRPFSELKVATYEIVINETTCPRSQRTLCLSILHQMYRYAMRYDIVTRDVSALVDFKQDTAPQIDRKAFTAAEIAELSKHRTAYDDLLLVGIYTGMRPSELCALSREHLHLDGNHPYIVHGSKTENGRNRVIPIHPNILPIITERAAKPPKFDGEPIFGITYVMLQRYCKEKTPHYPHDTRHTFATLAKRSELDAYCIKRIMGHTVKDLTEQVYTHRSPDDLYREMLKFTVS